MPILRGMIVAQTANPRSVSTQRDSVADAFQELFSAVEACEDSVDFEPDDTDAEAARILRESMQ